MPVKEPGMKHTYTTYNQYKSAEVLKLKNNTVVRLYSIAIHANNLISMHTITVNKTIIRRKAQPKTVRHNNTLKISRDIPTIHESLSIRTHGTFCSVGYRLCT